MKLKLWLLSNRISITEFAEKIGISRGHLHHVMGGKKTLSQKNLKKIQQLTSRKVFTFEDLVWQNKSDAK